MDGEMERVVENPQGKVRHRKIRNRDDEDDSDQFDNDVDRIFYKLSALPSYEQFPDLMQRCRLIVTLWHDTFSIEDKHLWKKMKRNLPKELNESAFILDEMISVCNMLPDGNDPITIIDMCSGVGYLSMFLSHLLPAEKVGRIIPIDVLFAAHNNASATIDSTKKTDDSLQQDGKVEEEAKSSSPTCHLSVRHLSSDIHPIPIKSRKANIKKGRELRQISKYCVSSAPGPVIILGVHLCKSLSVHTTRLFTMNSNASRLYLKPCCLPGRKDLQRRVPPFWTFEGMQGGGFGVKTLYCEEVRETTEAEAVVDIEPIDVLSPIIAADLEGENVKEDGHINKNASHVLFSKWTGLLRDAANSADGVTANIRICSVQANHFQNQFILAKRLDCISVE
jgi:hypothetical protein